MTDWIALVPAGDTCHVKHAEVTEAKVMRVDQLDAWARLEAARREYERLAGELGVNATSPTVQFHSAAQARPALRVVDDDVEEHRAFKVPGPRFACLCNNVYDHAEDLQRHRPKCGVYARHRNLDGHAEKDQFKWGVT